MPSNEPKMDERLASLERGLEHMKAGLGLLGLKPCSWCGVFFRRSDPGALFDGGELVCFDCIPGWWSHRAPQLSAEDRQKRESALRRWLVSHHNAEVIGRLKDLPKAEELKLKLVTPCEHCNGTGKTYSGGRCHHCDGRGTIWVVVRQPDLGRNEPEPNFRDR